MTELHKDPVSCSGCKHRVVIYNEKCDGKLRAYCRQNEIGRDDCREFKQWGD